jgi:hypothetical protein
MSEISVKDNSEIRIKIGIVYTYKEILEVAIHNSFGSTVSY